MSMSICDSKYSNDKRKDIVHIIESLNDNNDYYKIF